MEKIIHDTDRDFYLNAQGAKEYNLIDEVALTAKGRKRKGKSQITVIARNEATKESAELTENR